MNDTLTIAIVAASSAIIGALVPAIFSYLNDRRLSKEKEKEQNRQLKVQKYSLFIDSLQYFMNHIDDINAFISFQNSINSLLLFADNNTAKITNEYWKKMIKLNAERRGLNAQEHTEFQTKIFNSIRTDIGVSSEKLENVLLISFRPQ